MENYSYYTPITLADELLKLVEEKKYQKAIDICCGSWNLLKAARKKNLCDKAVGIDVDYNVHKYMPDYCKFICMDGRLYSLKPENKGKYDLVLSNPPFGRIENDNRILKDYIEDKEISLLLYKRYEVEMLIANMMLLRKGGVLLAILPRTIVYGPKYKKLRVYIAKHYYVKAIIDLPDNSFGKREISTIAMVIENRESRKGAELYSIDKIENWKMRKCRAIKKKELLTGDWTNDSALEKRADIYRGKIGSNYFDENGTNTVLHCSSVIIGTDWKPVIKKTKMYCNDKCTQYGDVIISRVGRFAGYWTINTFGTHGVSDCLIVIKNPSSKTLDIIKKNSKNNRLTLPLYGVTTKYIIQSDVCKMLKNNENIR
jgi:type I restriction enzyme M protein